MDKTKSYTLLLKHHELLSNNYTIKSLFDMDVQRANKYHLSYDGVYYDFSKNLCNIETLELLKELYNEEQVSTQIEAMFRGDIINNTEQRQVLHTALRHSIIDESNNYLHFNNLVSIYDDIRQILFKMKSFTEKIHAQDPTEITDIINVGIGGSHLGPKLLCEALDDYKIQKNIKMHFISSVDGVSLYKLLKSLNPATSLFIIVSKTFTTMETMTNAITIKNWLVSYYTKNHTINNTMASNKLDESQIINKHFVAISSNIQQVLNFGISEDNIFPMWDFVGGRYSVYSAVGLSVMLLIGFENFIKFLAGARSMDYHFYNERANPLNNIPVVLALIEIWHRNFCNYSNLLVSPYNNSLKTLPSYIMQLVMESNGKNVTKQGELISTYQTSPIVWGDSGIDGQHAYYQLLHQGTMVVPTDFIMALSNKNSDTNHHDMLFANCIAQSKALMDGNSDTNILDKHKLFLGNRPSNTILFNELSPYYLGMLLAMYEHKTFVTGIIWNINSFDQMGVELGKKLAQNILTTSLIEKQRSISQHDSSTNELIKRYLKFYNS